MLNACDALDDLLVAAGRARDLHDALAAAVRRADDLRAETNWHARAADGFRDRVRTWCGDLVRLRLELADLESEATRAAHRLQTRMDHALVGVVR